MRCEALCLGLLYLVVWYLVDVPGGPAFLGCVWGRIAGWIWGKMVGKRELGVVEVRKAVIGCTA